MEISRVESSISLVFMTLIFGFALSLGVNAHEPSMSEMTNRDLGGAIANTQSQDPAFDKGRNIYFGRTGCKKYNYCLAVELVGKKYRVNPKLKASERLPFSRKTIRAFRRSESRTLVTNAFDCDEPSRLIFRQLKMKEKQFLIYFWNKKYKLRMKGW